MNIQAITPNNSSSYNKTAYNNSKKVAFQGVSPELLKATPDEFISGAKKTFGFSTKKLKMSFEKLINAIKELSQENKTLKEGLYDAQDQLFGMPEKLKTARQEEASKLTKYYEERLTRQAADSRSALEKAQNEINIARKATQNAEEEKKAAENITNEYRNKFGSLEIKSAIQDVILPERGIKLVDEIIEHQSEAKTSLINFMLKGEGQEPLLEQLSRYSVLESLSKTSSKNSLIWNRDFENALNKLYGVHPKDNQPIRFRDLLLKVVSEKSNEANLLQIPKVRKQAVDNLTTIVSANNLLEFPKMRVESSDYISLIQRHLNEIIDNGFKRNTSW